MHRWTMPTTNRLAFCPFVKKEESHITQSLLCLQQQPVPLSASQLHLWACLPSPPGGCSPQTSWPAHTQHPANTYTNNTCSILHKLLGKHIHITQSTLTPTTTPANGQNHCSEVSVKLGHINCSYLNPGTQI